MWKLFIARAVAGPALPPAASQPPQPARPVGLLCVGPGRGWGPQPSGGKEITGKTGLVGLRVLFLSHPLVFCLLFSRAGCSEVRRALDPNRRLWGWLETCSPFAGGPERRSQPGMAQSARRLWLCSLAVLQMAGDRVVCRWAATTPDPQTLPFKSLQIPSQGGVRGCPSAQRAYTQVSLEEMRMVILKWPDEPSLTEGGVLGRG